MNYDMILNELKQWNEDEIFYREYFYIEKDSSDLECLINRTGSDLDFIDFALHPDQIDPHKTENTFFNGGCNVTLIKHPRYIPFFSHKYDFFEIIYVLSGHCTQIMNRNHTELTEGDLCLLAPNVTHGIEVFDDSIIINILIRQSTFMDIFFNTICDKSQISLFFFGKLYEKNKIRYLVYHTYHDRIIRDYILDMYIEHRSLDDFSDRIICSLLTIFFTQLTRRHGKAVEIPDSLSSRSDYGK